MESLDIPEDTIESSISVFAIDPEGYQSRPTTRSIRISSAAPATPTINAIADDNIINAFEKSIGVLLEGSAEGSDFIELSWGGLVATLQVLPDGSWSTVIGGPNSQGVIPQDVSRSLLTVVAVDADGNRSEEATRELVIDTRPPSPPSLNQVAEDNIINAVEEAAGVTLTGTSDIGTKLSVKWGLFSQTVDADSDGKWSIYVARESLPGDDSRSQICLQATDVAGNQSSVTRERVVIDTRPPDAPLIDQVGTDDILNSAEAAQTVFLTGRAERGSLVEVDWNNKLFTTTATSSGRWALPIGTENLPPNGSSSSITVSATDDAGNRSAIATRSVLVDLVAPNAPVLNLVGQNGIVNALQKASGITLSGTAEAGTTIFLHWARIERESQVNPQGLWTINIQFRDSSRWNTRCRNQRNRSSWQSF